MSWSLEFDSLCEKGLRWFTRALVFCFYGFLRRSRLFFVLILLIVAGSLPGLKKLRVLVSFRDLFDSKIEASDHNFKVESAFQEQNLVFLLVTPKEGAFSADSLRRLQLWVTTEQFENPELISVVSAFDLRKPVMLDGVLKAQPVFSAANPDTSFKYLMESPWAAVLTNPAGRDLGLQFNYRNTPGGSAYGLFDPKPIDVTMRSFERQLGGLFDARWTGPSMYDFHMREGMKRMPFINLAVFLLILVSYRIFTGTWRSGWILGGSLILVSVFLYCLMGHFGHPIDILTSGLFLMLSVATHQDFSFLSAEMMRTGHSPIRCARRMLVPSFFTSLTTFIGFSSLVFSDLGLVQRFGLWAAVGSMLEFFFVLLVIPALASQSRWVARWTRKKIADPARAAETRPFLSPQIGRWLLAGGFASAAVSVFFLNLSDNPQNIFPSHHPFRQALDYLDETRHWQNVVSLVFPADSRASKERLLNLARAAPQVRTVETAQVVLDSLESGLTGLDKATVDTQLRASKFLSRYVAPSGTERALIYVDTSDLLNFKSFKSRIEAACAGQCWLAGPLDMYVEFIYQVSRTLLHALSESLILVSAVLFFLFAALRIGQRTLLWLTAFWGPMMMLTLVAVFQIPLNAYTCHFASVLVGLAGDNTIQFAFAGRRGRLRRGLGHRGHGAGFTSCVMALCSLTFGLSAFHPPRVLGALLCAGFFVCFIGDYFLLQSLIREDGSDKAES